MEVALCLLRVLLLLRLVWVEVGGRSSLLVGKVGLILRQAVVVEGHLVFVALFSWVAEVVERCMVLVPGLLSLQGGRKGMLGTVVQLLLLNCLRKVAVVVVKFEVLYRLPSEE